MTSVSELERLAEIGDELFQILLFLCWIFSPHLRLQLFIPFKDFVGVTEERKA